MYSLCVRELRQIEGTMIYSNDYQGRRPDPQRPEQPPPRTPEPEEPVPQPPQPELPPTGPPEPDFPEPDPEPRRFSGGIIRPSHIVKTKSKPALSVRRDCGPEHDDSGGKS